jgi:hypothetical protein
MNEMHQLPEKFSSFLHEFRMTDLWRNMANTVEASPWHREANVAVHTDMLLDWYVKNILPRGRTENQQLLSLIACTMHDIGKPMAEVTKFSEERGTYRSYAGHELLSARLWMDYSLSNAPYLKALFGFTLEDFSNIALMVEHHVPFGLKDKRKRANLKLAFLRRIGTDGHQAWIDMLLSDQHGRIADDQPQKLAAVAEWLEAWEQI